VQGRRWLWWVWALVGPAALAGIILAVWKLPSLLYGDVSQASADARLQASSGFRTALVAGLAGLAALGSLVMASRTYRLTQQGQLTDRYTKAIEQLGSDKQDVRLGGIYALERIAKDSAHDQATIAEVLTAFIRGHAPWPPRPDQPGEGTPIKEMPYLRYRAADVQAALTVLGRQPSMTRSQPPNLSDTDLRRADLSNAELQGARLLGARLQGANLRAAQLLRVNLSGAQLHGARSNTKTVWPEGFDWEAAGVELVED
jgi:pentapeptide repeat protein